MELSETQKNYIIQFFEQPECTGWYSIAEQLVSEQYCLIPEMSNFTLCNEIARFVSYTKPKDTKNIVKLSFDLSGFIGSEYFLSHKKWYIGLLTENIEEAKTDLFLLERRKIEIEQI